MPNECSEIELNIKLQARVSDFKLCMCFIDLI